MSNLHSWMTNAHSHRFAQYLEDIARRAMRNLDLKVAAERERAIEKNVFIASAWGRVDSVARNGIFSIINMRLRGLVYVEGDL